MTAFMSYQYPQLPSSGSTIDDVSSNFMNNAHLPAIIPPPYSRTEPYTKPSSPNRNRGTSTAAKSARMRRSVSSPNVRGQAASDAAALASAEKRRNKLGYHRTSVACSHCRRRKIRCIPAQSDAQNRCANCIRLKKDCIFLPVDSQQQSDAARRDSKVQGTLGRTSSSPSPTTSQIDMQHPLPYPVMNVSHMQDLDGPSIKRPRTGSFSSENKDYSQTAPSWIPSDSAVISKASGDMSSSYWRTENNHGSPGAPTYPQFTPNSNTHLPRQSDWPPSAIEPSHREQLDLSVPQRAMSYGSLEGLQHQAPYANFPTASGQSSRDEFSPRPGGHQTGTYASMPPSSLGGEMIPRTSTATVTHPTAYSTPQSWQPAYTFDKAPLPVPNAGGYSPWYGSSVGIQPQPQSGAENSASTAYSHPDTFNGMLYYPTGR